MSKKNEDTENLLSSSNSSLVEGSKLGKSFGGGLDENLSNIPSSHITIDNNIKNLASNMRKNQTEAERKIWKIINKKQLGYAFRRQFNIRNKYIVDFICLEKKLIIEVDGGQHCDNEKDIERTGFLNQEGYQVLRFWNNEVMNNIESCYEIIVQELNENSTLHQNTASQVLTPPQGRSKKRIIIIAGPTASGKSSVAIDLAKKENGVIINCDSMQVYDILRVVTARPSEEDEKECPHRLYGYLSPAIACNADMWRKQALIEIDDVLLQGKLPIVVGGTGMYIKSLMEGLSPIPDIPTEIRTKARARLEKEGSQTLYKEIAEEDRNKLSENDSQRICRAYEVFKSTGKSMVYWNSQENVGIRSDLDFDLRIVMPEFEGLYKKCNSRFEQMIEQGALEEVKELMAMDLDPSLPSMRAIGVPEIIAYLKGELSLEEAKEKAQQQTRNYAKRQRTWFNRIKCTNKGIEKKKGV